MITPELVHRGKKSKEQFLLTRFQEFGDSEESNKESEE